MSPNVYLTFSFIIPFIFSRDLCSKVFVFSLHSFILKSMLSHPTFIPKFFMVAGRVEIDFGKYSIVVDRDYWQTPTNMTESSENTSNTSTSYISFLFSIKFNRLHQWNHVTHDFRNRYYPKKYNLYYNKKKK